MRSYRCVSDALLFLMLGVGDRHDGTLDDWVRDWRWCVVGR